MFERFTEPARQAVANASIEARGLNHNFIGTEHLLLALAAQDHWVADALARRGLTPARARGEVERIVGRGPRAEIDPRIDPAALATLGIDLDEVRRRVETTFGPEALARKPKRVEKHGQTIRFTPRAKRALELALREARALGHNYIAPNHLILGLLRSNGVAGQILNDHGVDAAAFRSPPSKSDRQAG